MSGAALMETMLTIPLLLMISGGMLDLGRIFVEYMKVSRVAYEGSRLASKTQGLEVKTNGIGEICTTDGTVQCCVDTTYCPWAYTSANLNLKTAIVRTYGMMPYSNFKTASGVTAPYFAKVRYDQTNDTVAVTATVQIQLVWFFFGNRFTVRSTSTSPYLY